MLKVYKSYYCSLLKVEHILGIKLFLYRSVLSRQTIMGTVS